MPTYAQLASEPEWGAQYTPQAMLDHLVGPLRAFYGLGPNAIGAAGDNNHLYGRHRSYAWDANSRYCTDRGYGTTDARDQAGDRNWYRAVDVGITGQALFDASHRVDALVRSGRAPGIAEWFGTFDGRTVVGWFQGAPSSSDSSHLTHLHLGFWNGSANDPALMQLAFATITSTGPTPPPKDDDMPKLLRVAQTGMIILTNGTTWYHLGTDELVDAARVIWGLGPPSDISEQHLDACGTQVPFPTTGGGGTGGLTEKQVEDAAFRGAQRAEDS